MSVARFSSRRAVVSAVVLGLASLAPAAQAVPGDPATTVAASTVTSPSVEAEQASALAQAILAALRATNSVEIEVLRTAVQNAIAESGASPRVVSAALDALRVCPTGQAFSLSANATLPLNGARMPSGVLTSAYLLNTQSIPGGAGPNTFNMSAKTTVGQGQIAVRCVVGLTADLTELQTRALADVQVTVQALLGSVQPAASGFAGPGGLGAPPSAGDGSGGGSDYR